MLSASFDVAGLSAHFDRLNEAIGTGVRVAAQAGAQVFYDEVKLRASRIKDSGTLAGSIYQKYVKELSTDGLSARYHISWRKGEMRRKIGQSPSGPMEGGLWTAPHGQLIEYGWIQRYAVHKAKDGQWYTIVQAKNRGKKAPWIGAGKGGKNKRPTQAQLDDWYLPRPDGPVQHLPRSFLRSSYEAKKAEAVRAAVDAMQKHVARAFL